MKTTIFCIIIFVSANASAQLHSGTPVVQTKVQPVPNAATTEKSAPPQPVNIPVPANPVPPVYPGAEAKAVEMPRQLVNPPAAPSPTQPIQKEPLSPVESTNTLQPNRPPRDQASRENKAVSLAPVISNKRITAADYNNNSNKPAVIYKKPVYTNTTKKPAPAKPSDYKKPNLNKKPR